MYENKNLSITIIYHHRHQPRVYLSLFCVLGSSDIVTFSHIISPSHFYVQRKSCQSQLDKLREHFSRKSNIRKNQPTSIKEGKTFVRL